MTVIFTAVCMVVMDANIMICMLYDSHMKSVVQNVPIFSNRGITQARTAYLCIGFHVLLSIIYHFCHPPTFGANYINDSNSSRTQTHYKSHYKLWSCLLNAWTLFMLLLLRPHNIPLVALVFMQHQALSYVMQNTDYLSPAMKTLVFYWMGQAAFYYQVLTCLPHVPNVFFSLVSCKFFSLQGNSNSLSSIDVSAGYVGLSDYQPLIIGILMALATYAGPIFWLSGLIAEICRSQNCPHR